MSTPRLVIQDEAHHKRRRLLFALIGAIVLALALGVFQLGRMQGPGNWDSYQVKLQRLSDERKRLVQDNRELSAQSRELSQQIVALQRAADVDEVSAGELRDALTRMQERLETLHKELAFYRGIVSPEEVKAGVRVQQFTLDKTGDEQVYKFDLVLIQSAKHDKQIKGKVNIRLDGLRDGEAISLNWKEVALDSGSNIVFSFQYFEEINGTFRLPENFDPTLVEVELVPSSRGDESFVDRYDWNDLI